MTTYKTVTRTTPMIRTSDRRKAEFVRAGKVLGNVAAYLKWMKESWGDFIGAENHAKRGIEEGRFIGEIEPKTGNLIYDHGIPPDPITKEEVSKYFDWKQMNEGT